MLNCRPDIVLDPPPTQRVRLRGVALCCSFSAHLPRTHPPLGAPSKSSALPVSPPQRRHDAPHRRPVGLVEQQPALGELRSFRRQLALRLHRLGLVQQPGHAFAQRLGQPLQRGQAGVGLAALQFGQARLLELRQFRQLALSQPLRFALGFDTFSISARQFTDRTLIEIVNNALRKNDMLAENLELEITESTIMQNVKTAGAILDALDTLGVRLAIDDFGTGYSSLAYLKRFPLDVLKIDQVFVRDIAYDSNVRAIIEASITLGHKLGLEVIAEGVETAEQVDFLIAQECDMIQGYYLSRPVPSADAVSYTSTYLHTSKQS